ncbi:MAG: prenyltransferase/squalene oxidase repeat-containing protein [Planctomycetota bacterium]|jgi:hypothetical protein
MRRTLDTIPLILSILVGIALVTLAGEKKEAPDRAAVERALDRGVAYLRKKQKGDGSWQRDVGYTGLVLYALAHAGADPDDKAVRRGTRWLVASLARPRTYDASLAIMALATLDRKGQKKRIARLASLLEIGQCKNGQWSYKLRRGRSGGDNSNTQFAALALWYARRAGVTVSPQVFERCLGFFRDTQNEDGGWGYSAKERKKSYGSMTATGLAALVVCRAGLEKVRLSDPRARKGPAVAKATEWITKHFGVDRNPEANFKLGEMQGTRKQVTDSFWQFYWLWSLERAATLAGVTRFGEHDWYGAGARLLVDRQRDDGSWVGSEAPLPATAFAVLFLSRSTRKVVVTEDEEVKASTTPDPK